MLVACAGVLVTARVAVRSGVRVTVAVGGRGVAVLLGLVVGVFVRGEVAVGAGVPGWLALARATMVPPFSS